MMRKHEVLGEAPLPGFTHRLFGKVYHMVYSNGGGEWLFDRINSKFIPLPPETSSGQAPSKGDKQPNTGCFDSAQHDKELIINQTNKITV